MSDEPAVTPDPLPPDRCGNRWGEKSVVENTPGSTVVPAAFVGAVCGVLLELGLFLLVYLRSHAWADNYFSVTLPGSALSTWRTLWNNPYVRGGVSGLGLVNVWIAVAEVFRMFAGRSQTGQ